MKENRTGDLDRLTEEELTVRIERLDTLAKPLEEGRRRLQKQIAGLRRQLKPLQREDAQLGERLAGLDEERSRIRDLRNEKSFVRLVKERLQRDGEIFKSSNIPMVRNLGQVIGKIVADERFVAFLPQLLEPTFIESGSYKGFSNSDRIVVQAGGDKCRIMLCDRGNYGIVYNLYTHTRAQINPVLKHIPPWHVVDGHFFGIRISLENHLAVRPLAVQPFTLGWNKEGSRCEIPLSLPEELLDLILDKLTSVLAQGEICLPQKFGHLTISPISR